MRPWSRLASVSIPVAVALLALPQIASAQIGQTPFPQPTQGPQQDKPSGVAEEAPDDPAALPTVPTMPAPKSKRKQFRIFELDGYFRLRTNWFKNLNTNFDDDPAFGGAPFPEPLACNTARDMNQPCEETLKHADMRLRLEPIISLSEGTSVHMQVDVLDNLVLGSTPTEPFLDPGRVGAGIPIGAFAGSQREPIAGYNSDRDSIVVKRAWAEVETVLGLIKFGRMPDHWGLGIQANSGGADPIHGTYNLDADYGDTVDRLMFSRLVPGTDLRLAVGMDWVSTTPVASQTDIYAGRLGQPWDLDDNDDVNQWMVAISRMDTPEEFADKVARGDLALNYGVYFLYRTQNWAYTPAADIGGPVAPDRLVPRGLTSYVPDAWLRVGWGDLELEAEAVANIGSIDSVDQDLGIPEDLDIRQFGGVARLTYKLVGGDLRLQLEGGYASGDQFDHVPEGSVHVSDARFIRDASATGDTSINLFAFDPDYHVDLIFFREMMGAIHNASYARPNLAYDITDEITFRAASILSWANRVEATPGDSRMYGIEFNGDLGYAKDGYFAGIAYGALFPLGGLNHPPPTTGGPAYDYGTVNIGDAGTAQTIQARFMLAF